jgi:hypothetical protein
LSYSGGRTGHKYKPSDVVWKMMQAENVNFAWERILLTVFEIAESGACKTGQGDAGIPETVSPNQYDG